MHLIYATNVDHLRIQKRSGNLRKMNDCRVLQQIEQETDIKTRIILLKYRFINVTTGMKKRTLLTIHTHIVTFTLKIT